LSAKETSRPVDSPIAIERAVAADVAALVPLFEAYRAFYRQPADTPGAESFLRERLEKSESVVLLARDGETAVGFAQLYPLFSSTRMVRLWLLNDLYVVPAARRGGVARRLLGAVEAFARQNGASELMLSTHVNNRTAQRVYEAAGWRRDDEFSTYLRAL
jgi:GNAT superfamily N-acetyltransferase